MNGIGFWTSILRVVPSQEDADLHPGTQTCVLRTLILDVCWLSISAYPFFLILIFFEAWIGHVKGEIVVRSMDTLASLISGVTNVFKDVLGLTVIIVSYDWMVGNLSLLQIQETWIIYLIAFIGLDFSGYWVHRISHKINYFWNQKNLSLNFFLQLKKNHYYFC